MFQIQSFVVKEVAKAAAKLLEEQKDDLRIAAQAALAAQDLPLPDNLEKPLDDLLLELIDITLNMIIGLLKSMS